ncbi:hypothetical protein SAMD00019534_042690, partial [Acytostelium subglobosum LB1]|uniref:hypothetical protein n=1 Tax=Acytostelium subglobosum LB1 TaxID=1410327 RepID=UPI0006447C1C
QSINDIIMNMQYLQRSEDIINKIIQEGLGREMFGFDIDQNDDDDDDEDYEDDEEDEEEDDEDEEL